MSAAAVEQAYREEWSTVVATLARRLGDLQRAEDATQEAFTRAAAVWPRDGTPNKPGAWLTVTAWRIALNQLRHDRLLTQHATELEAAIPAAPDTPDDEEILEMEDDRLGLIFACCHPALALEVRVALTLRYLAGLTTREIASAFLVPEPTMAQRLVRAKHKILQAGIRFEAPAPEALADRLSGVQRVIYLVFNEGYLASGGGRLLRLDLSTEALWLGRLLHRLLPDDAETIGLLALMLLLHARTPARQDAAGRPVPLSEQNRELWHRPTITEGIALLDRAILLRRPGPYQLQAAIAALHAEAASFAETDWTEISLLYGELARLAPSSVVEVNRAVVVGMADGPRAGLAMLEPILASGALADYAPLHAAHAELLDRAGEREAAIAAWSRAIATTENAAVRAELQRRVAQRLVEDEEGTGNATV
jgi:RNA polymerase sigma-70 factor (ECF subfamily)